MTYRIRNPVAAAPWVILIQTTELSPPVVVDRNLFILKMTDTEVHVVALRL